MTQEEFTKLVESLKAQGMSEEDILGTLLDMFKEGKVEAEDLKKLAGSMGYEVTEEFEKLASEGSPSEEGEKPEGEISEEEVEEAQEIPESREESSEEEEESSEEPSEEEEEEESESSEEEDGKEEFSEEKEEARKLYGLGE